MREKVNKLTKDYDKLQEETEDFRKRTDAKADDVKEPDQEEEEEDADN